MRIIDIIYSVLMAVLSYSMSFLYHKEKIKYAYLAWLILGIAWTIWSFCEIIMLITHY